MFASLYAVARRRRFHWKPALSNDHGRHSVVLTTFPFN